MAKVNIVSAIDIGTDKVCTIIAQVGETDRDLKIMGVSSVASKGLRKSQIVDLDEAISSLTESVDSAERMAGLGIKSAYVSAGGAQITSLNSKGVVAVANPDGEIVDEDVRRVIEAARAVSLPTGQDIMHVIPRDFKVDSQEGIKDPVGMSGVRLESEAHIITGSATALKNITKCMNDIGVGISGFVFSGLASSYSTLTETEKELGVVLVDIGSGSTSICAYIEGSLMYSGVLPIGARHVTSDIALGTRVSLQSAEKIKLALSVPAEVIEPPPNETRDQARQRKKLEDELDVSKLSLTEDIKTVSRKTLVEGIIGPRLQEMFKLIGNDLEKNKLFAQIPAGIVLTGGGAQTVGIVEVCKKVLGMPTRLGIPTANFMGLVDEIETPIYSTATGLLLYGAKEHGGTPSQEKGRPVGDMFKGIQVKGIKDAIIKFIKSVIP